jgi:hypothetical protein
LLFRFIYAIKSKLANPLSLIATALAGKIATNSRAKLISCFLPKVAKLSAVNIELNSRYLINFTFLKS